MKTVIGISHFFKSNTPKFWQALGDLGLIVSTLSGLIMGIPETLAAAGVMDYHLPPMLMKINTICLVIGALVKFISKLIGQKDVLADGTK